MPSVRSLQSLLAAAIAALLTTVCAVSNAFATPDSARRPVILDSQGGINDGQSGTVVQTGPLSLAADRRCAAHRDADRTGAGIRRHRSWSRLIFNCP